MAQTFDYESNVMAGGVPPLTQASANVPITMKAEIYVSTTTGLADGDNIALVKIPANHELTDFVLYVDDLDGSTNASALSFDVGIFATDVATNSTVANALAVTCVDGTTVGGAGGAGVVRPTSGAYMDSGTYTPTIKASDHVFGICVETDPAVDAAGYICAMVSYKPIAAYEASKTVAG